ncbi:MAG TPA: hypothetical protein VHE30_10370 [Polyangiaceae bacterium]|nr:hypothetical protein [Polyangiaceae bacterium]
MANRARAEFGDFQTPRPLAEAALGVLRRAPRAIVEPTCGEGAFLHAAAARFPGALLRGWEVKPEYAARARRALPRGRSRVRVGDFFAVDWERELAALPEPLAVVGNPPWVTNSGLSVLRSENLPPKTNWRRLSGIDALTGKSNFDLGEWILLRLLAALVGRRAELAVLCKAAVARAVLTVAGEANWPIASGALHRIDAGKLFGASVAAVLLHVELGERGASRVEFPVHERLGDRTCARTLSFQGGVLVADSERFARTAHLAGRASPEWRSGMKHDAAAVMELTRVGRTVRNAAGEILRLEPAHLFPLLKSSDVANGRTETSRLVIVPQRKLGEDTTLLARRAPRLHAYLLRHADALAARRSAIYRGRPPFSVFGIGEYSFAPWKVAISGLYKRLAFALVGPVGGRPVLFDDTCYFLPFQEEAAARRVHRALSSELARDYFEARVFWDEKRPIDKALLQSLDLERLQEAAVRGTRSSFSER